MNKILIFYAMTLSLLASISSIKIKQCGGGNSGGSGGRPGGNGGRPGGNGGRPGGNGGRPGGSGRGR